MRVRSLYLHLRNKKYPFQIPEFAVSDNARSHMISPHSTEPICFLSPDTSCPFLGHGSTRTRLVIGAN